MGGWVEGREGGTRSPLKDDWNSLVYDSLDRSAHLSQRSDSSSQQHDLTTLLDLNIFQHFFRELFPTIVVLALGCCSAQNNKVESPVASCMLLFALWPFYSRKS